MFSLSLYTILLVVTVAHLMLTAVMALFARHRVQYLSLAIVMGIFGFGFLVLMFFANDLELASPVKLGPEALIGLTATVFLQSIYPLSIPMPAYLQWPRMFLYAAPAFFLFVLYGLLLLLGFQPTRILTWQDFYGHLFSGDILLRLAFLGLSGYYIFNIFRLPRTLLHQPDIPRYIVAYCIALGVSSCIFMWLSVDYSLSLFEVWLFIMTLQNLYMCFRTLETLALSLPKPVMRAVEEEPAAAVAEEGREEDFNEANRLRFERIEFWMQHHHDEWKDYTFGRDQLCAAVGLNRHLLLQSVRSQGYYNIHEYINTYRIAELQRMITRGEVRTLGACQDAGFGTVKTARSSFEKVTGGTLDDYLAKYK